MRRRVRRLKAANPGRVVEVWAEDEARLGLKPITRRVWWLTDLSQMAAPREIGAGFGPVSVPSRPT